LIQALEDAPSGGHCTGQAGYAGANDEDIRAFAHLYLYPLIRDVTRSPRLLLLEHRERQASNHSKANVNNDRDGNITIYPV
jgi:hypothetical protein